MVTHKNYNAVRLNTVFVCLLVEMLSLSCSTEDVGLYEDVPVEAKTETLSLNELMFDPIGDGVDYVELVNVSDLTLDLSAFSIHNRNSKGELNKGHALSQHICLLAPGRYCLLTSDTASLAASYCLAADSVILQVKGFPSMPNAGGNIVITDSIGNVVDECEFLPSMHHPLMANREGVALEKLHPHLSSSLPSSWASAASDVSYGTPGCINSQFRPYLGRVDSCGFFLPRNWLTAVSDDSTSFLTLVYRNINRYLPIVSVEVCSRSGEKVATLVENGVLGVNGVYIWYGQDDKGNQLPCGQYIIRILVNDMEGNVVRQNLVCHVLGI